MLKVFVFSIVLLFIQSCQSNSDLIVIETDLGSFTIEVDFHSAPKHSANFVKLVNEGFYDGLTIYRIIGGTLIQGGESHTIELKSTIDSNNSQKYSLDNEFGLKNIRGAVGASYTLNQGNSQGISDGSQFYICLANLPIWDGKYTVFGKVVENIYVVDKISWAPMDLYNTPNNPIYIKRAYLK